MRTALVRISALAALCLGGTGLAACGDDSSSSGTGPDIVVTTNILGDIVEHLVGDAAHIEVVMPPGTDPHDFAASARQAQDMRTAHVLVVNGLHFEAGLDDTIAAARDDGATVVTLADLVPHRLTVEEDGTPAADPHVFNDPARMAVAVGALGDALGKDVPGLDTPAYAARVDAYVAQLHDLDTEMTQTLSVVPSADRVLVTNHEALGYFADHFGFRVLGTVIPSLSTLAETSARDLAQLADAVRRADVPAIFADTTSPSRLADALAAEVGRSVQVVQLFAESLGPKGSGATTYIDMLRTNAQRIAEALTPSRAG